MKTSRHPSIRRSRFGSSVVSVLTFALASLSLAGACDVEDADGSLPGDVELVYDEELRAAVLAPTSPQELEARGISEEDVASFQSRVEDLVAEDDDPTLLACSACSPTTLGFDCMFCCTTNLQECNVFCGPPQCP